MNNEADDRKNDRRKAYGRRSYDHAPADGQGAPHEDGQQRPDGEQGGGEGAPREDQQGKGQNGAPQNQKGDRKDGAKADSQPSTPSPKTVRYLAWGGAIALVAAALLAGLLFFLHHHKLTTEAERRRQDVDRGPRVFVTEARAAPAVRDLTLPGDVRGFLQATVYAKVSGYVKSIVVDKGDHVTEGQVLGVLESPEVDQQVAGAQADLVIKQRTFQRYQQLVKKDYVSQQDFETAGAQFQVSQATVKQMKAMQAYETLRAPFAGVVTARYVDQGALVPAATGSTQSALPLVDIADLHRLRILVFVQQDAAPFVHAGDTVRIGVDQQPDLRIDAPINRCADALDPRTRAMLCEIWIANDHHLFPGAFVHVTLHLAAPRVPVIDSSALLMRGDKPSVAIVRQSHVHFANVRPGLDDGKTVQIVAGLRAGERVVLSPPFELAEGAVVQEVEQKAVADGASAETKETKETKKDGGASDAGGKSPGDGAPRE
jgi:membrane fusion protein, multidrug efflux system